MRRSSGRRRNKNALVESVRPCAVGTRGNQEDRNEVWNYIVADNPQAATRMDELFS